METLIQNIPVAAALVLPVVLVLMVVTNIIVEVLKKLTWGKLPTNLLAFAVAMAVTLLAFFAACQIMGVAVTHGGGRCGDGRIRGLCRHVRL